MKKLLGLSLLLLSSLWAPLAAQLTQVPLGSSAAPYGYYEYLPFGYDDASTEEWPVVIFLHGIGERGNGTTELSRVLNTGLPKNIAGGTKYPFVAIMPQTPTSGLWSASTLDTLVQFVKANYHVNEDRVYLTGLSMGGIGTWSYASANPEELAAIWPMCAAPSGTPNGAALIHVPTWAFTTWGDSQSGANPDYTVRWVNSIAAALGGGPLLDNYPGTYTGPPSPGNTSDKDRTASFTDSTNAWTWLDGVAYVAGSHPIITLYRDTAHNCWTRTYNNSAPMKWLLSQTRHGAANKAPTVSITAPSNNATLNDPTSITITAQATDSDGTLSSVEFHAGSQLLGTDNSAPHQFVWSNPAEGTHWITVKAVDDDGAVSASLVKVTVNLSSTPAALFQQDFQSSTSVASYVNATNPSTGQFNDISTQVNGGTWSIQGGRLQLVRVGGATDNDAYITRDTAFPGPPSLLHITFDLGVSDWTLSQFQTAAFRLKAGSGNATSDIFGDITVNGEGGGLYSFRAAGVESAPLNADGTLRHVSVFLNKSGAAATYRAPDGTLNSLRANGIALWVDSTPVVADAAAANGSTSSLAELRLLWASSEKATWQLDNFLIRGSFPQ